MKRAGAGVNTLLLRLGPIRLRLYYAIARKRLVVATKPDVLKEVLDETGKCAADIDWVVPHQANARILDATARKLELPVEKIVVTVDRHANTSAASVPLALDTAMRDGRIQPGDLVMFEAMGGGFTWGASLVRF